MAQQKSGNLMTLTPEYAIEYIKLNRYILNLSEVCKQCKINRSTMNKILQGVKSPLGYDYKFPERALPAMEKIIKELSFIPGNFMY
jgi:hypothetical protein